MFHLDATEWTAELLYAAHGARIDGIGRPAVERDLRKLHVREEVFVGMPKSQISMWVMTHNVKYDVS